MGACSSNTEIFDPIVPTLVKADPTVESPSKNQRMMSVSFDDGGRHIYMITQEKIKVEDIIKMIIKECGWDENVRIQLWHGGNKMRLYKRDMFDPDERINEYLDDYGFKETISSIACWNISKVSPKPPSPYNKIREPTPLELWHIKEFNEWLLNNGYEFMDPNKVLSLLRQYKQRANNSQFDQLVASVKQQK
jgi:hypothetical protein